MKKQIIFSTLALTALLIGTNSIHAQSNSATTQVQITLSDVISIDPGSVAIGGLVAFEYPTAADYNSTKTVNVPNSLKITSSKNFNVTAKAGGLFFASTTTTDEIPVGVLNIKPIFDGTMAGTASTISLNDQPQTIIGAATLGSAKTVTLQYEIPEAKSSSTEILGKAAAVYTQIVTYTATAI